MRLKNRGKHGRRYGLIAVCISFVLFSGCGVSPLWSETERIAGRKQETVRNETRKETESRNGTGFESRETGSKEETKGDTEDKKSGEETEVLPEKYDYREASRCPAAGSQGELGTCWAFATMMALESSLLPEETVDFSEDHISLHNSFGMSQDMGGDYTMAMAYLTGWQGPVLEAEDPYGDGISPEGLLPARHVQEVRILDNKDYDAIKRTVYFRGGVQTSLYIGLNGEMTAPECYREDTYGYFYGGDQISNHDVVIVGWDDTYPRENFSSNPGMDGAFLCMNSWGPDFGDGGLFYVSYADTNIGIHSLAYTEIDPADNYEKIYQSDLCGWLGQLGYGDEEAYFANVYRSEERELVEAAGFYATGPGTEYEVYIVHEAEENGRFTLGKPAASGKLRYSGFYTVKLESPVAVEPGERFAVAVKIKTPGAVHPVAIEYESEESELIAQVDLGDGEGYISADGKNWSDTESEQDSNVCLKAYTTVMEEREKR